MGTKNNPGEYDCYENAEPDEPMFVLLARDSIAAEVVRIWANTYSLLCGIDPTLEQNAKINEAYTCAAAMDKWHKENT